MDCSLLGSSIYGIQQARILEWAAKPSSRGFSWLRDWTCTSCIAGKFFATEPPGSPLIYMYMPVMDCKEIQPVYPKGDQSWVFTGGTDVKAETPILWPPDVESWLIWKDPDAGQDWGQEKGMTADEMIGWHHRLNGHGFGWTLGVDEGQGGLVCCRSWSCKELDTTEWLNWTELSV